ncbi:RING finger protein 225 [Nematolebias whitei]|uniref:RING finger protein 225 n=1 Tax=Nematolebias whitei TaxID=451745 RepID=UPI001898ACF7|nr:RING finger protein 225 [Nematolebias whitei]
MNPYTDLTLSEAAGSSESPNSSCPSSSLSIVQTGLSSQNILLHNSPSRQQSVHVWSLSPTLALPGFSPSSENPYAPPVSLHSYQVSISLPSPDVQLSPAPPQCSEETGPDLECSVCFSQFNNVFRCPKMLHCKHTFCLECLARINVKSAEPGAIQCPLCRGLTPLPTLGLPRLITDPDVLSYLPAAMQRVYSIRFIRNKGKLQVKRSSECPSHLGRGSLVNRTLDVGLPSPSSGGGGGVGGALFRLTGRPACRAFLLTSVVMMMVLLTAIVIFLLTYKNMG